MICTTTWCDNKITTQKPTLCKRCRTRLNSGFCMNEAPRKKVRNGASDTERLEFIGWTVSDSGCWEWSGRLDRKGYGVMATREKKQAFAHRTAHTEWVGPIPDELSVCHSCDNPKCINPEHLWLGTTKDNLQDMTMKHRGNTTKLSREQVLTIYSLRPGRKFGWGEAAPIFSELTARYGVADSAIRNIWNGETWSAVTGHKNELPSTE